MAGHVLMPAGVTSLSWSHWPAKSSKIAGQRSAESLVLLCYGDSYSPPPFPPKVLADKTMDPDIGPWIKLHKIYIASGEITGEEAGGKEKKKRKN